MKQKQSKNGVGMEREQNGNTARMEKKWRRNGVETEREWRRNGMETEREWRRNVAGMDPTPPSVPSEWLGPSASSCQVLNSATEELLAAATGTGWAALVWVGG